MPLSDPLITSMSPNPSVRPSNDCSIKMSLIFSSAVSDTRVKNGKAALEHACEAVPDMVILDGTPRFENTEEWEIQGVKRLAAEWGAELWTSSNTHREGQQTRDQ